MKTVWIALLCGLFLSGLCPVGATDCAELFESPGGYYVSGSVPIWSGGVPYSWHPCSTVLATYDDYQLATYTGECGAECSEDGDIPTCLANCMIGKGGWLCSSCDP